MNKNEIREIYSDSLLREAKSILKLSDEFRYTTDNMETTVNVTTEQINLLSEACKKNENLRKDYNQKNKNNKLVEDWPYLVMSTYFILNEIN
jgi:uncharacterized protein YoxC